MPLPPSLNATKLRLTEARLFGHASISAVPPSRQIQTLPPLQGGGDLSADRTLQITLTGGGPGAVGTGRQIIATTPLTGGGTLQNDVTLGVQTFGAANSGVVPASGGGVLNFLRADGQWWPGTISGVPDTRTIFTNPPLTGGGTLAGDLSLDILTFDSTHDGVVPASGGGTQNFLRADGTWQSPGSGSFLTLWPAVFPVPGVDTGTGHVTGWLMADHGLIAGNASVSAFNAQVYALGSTQGATSAQMLAAVHANDPYGPNLTFRKSRGTATVPLGNQSGDELAAFKILTVDTVAGVFNGNVSHEFFTVLADGADNGQDQPYLSHEVVGVFLPTQTTTDVWKSQNGIYIGKNVNSKPTPSARLHVAGSLAVDTKLKTLADNNYTLTVNDYRILCDAQLGGFSLNLPSAVSVPGREYEFLRVDKSYLGPVKIVGPISGVASIPLSGPNDSISVVSDGTNWWMTRDARSSLIGTTFQASGAIANTNVATFFNREIQVHANRLMNVGATFVFEASGAYSCTGTPTLSFSVGDIGAASILGSSGALTCPANMAGAPWQLRATFICRTIGVAATVLLTTGQAVLGNASLVPTYGLMINSMPLPTTNTTQDALYGVQVTWSAADPANTIGMDSMSIYAYGNGARSI